MKALHPKLSKKNNKIEHKLIKKVAPRKQKISVFSATMASMALVAVRLGYMGYTPEPLLEEVVVVVEAVSMPGRSNDPALRHNPPRRVTRAAEQSRGSRGPRSVLRCVTVRPGPPQPGGTEPALATASNTAASYSTLGGSLVSLASAAQQLQVWSL